MSEQQPTPKKKNSRWLFYVLAIVAFIFLVMYALRTDTSGTKLTVSEFDSLIGVQEITQNGTTFNFQDGDEPVIAAMIQQGNTFYVLLHTSIKSNSDLRNFLSSPESNADYYFFAHNHTEIARLIREWNIPHNAKWAANQETPSADFVDARIYFEQRGVVASWMDYVLSFLPYLLISGLIIFFLLRMMSSRGGLGNMGKNRATVTMSSPVRFNDVAGIEEEKAEVQEVVQFLRTPKKFLDLGARIPKGFLLVGSPGTGKTLLAKAIAGEAGVPFFSISGSDFSEMLVGVGPSRMRDLFEQAKAYAPSIIFIDEIDSIARMRGVGASGVSDENEQTLNQLLVQMDGFTKSEGVIVLAATNRPDVLDQALLRPGRFDRQIVVQIPDVMGREKILEVHSKHKPLGSDVDLKRIAKIISGFSGADIENLMNESAIIAAKKEKKKISMQDITEGINKVLLGPQKKSRIITDEDKNITAYHEAGHAIVSRVLQKDRVVQEVSIIPRGMAAGYTLTNERDGENHHKSKSFLNKQLAMYLGGRAAEEIFIGDICTGSTQDLKQATGLAERMVTSFGMSEKLGPLYYGKDEEIALRMYNDKQLSNELRATIDAEIKAIILAAEKSAREILKANSAKVKVMANVLLNRETIYAEDINLIMEGKSETAVIAAMEKRSVKEAEDQKKDKVDSELEALEEDFRIVMQMANAFIEAKLLDSEKFKKLEENMELARNLTKKCMRPDVLPNLDNINDYATIVASKSQEVTEEPNAEQPTTPEKPKKPRATKKPTSEETTKE
jgi:cell division protease FtsH